MSAYYLFMGKTLGYPSCCVNEFIERHNQKINAPHRKLYGTGYVPCKSCDLNYSEDELIANINKSRSKDLPPFSLNMKHFLLYSSNPPKLSYTYDSSVHSKHIKKRKYVRLFSSIFRRSKSN